MSSQNRVDLELWKQLKITRIKKVSFEVLLHMSSQSSVDLELQFLFPSSKSCAGRMTPIIMESG